MNVTHTTRSRPGFALFAVLTAIVLVSALTAATAFRAHEETLGVHAMTVQQLALSEAEHALHRALMTTDRSALDAAPLGTVLTSITSTLTTRTTVRIVKTTPTLLWLTAIADAQRGENRSKRLIGLSATLSQAAITPLPAHPWVDLL